MDYIIVFLVGAIASPLFLKVNPKIADKFFKITDKVEAEIEKRTGKNI